MDERLFIKEQKSQNRTQLILIISAVAFVVFGLGGMVVLLTTGNNSSQSTTPPVAVVEPEDNTPTPFTPQAETEPNTPNPTTPETIKPPVTPAQLPAATADYKPPTDLTKIHVYFPRSGDSSGILNPVLRDKPDSNVLSFGISQLVSGPNSQEKAEGLISTWSFTGSSSCDRNISYRFNISNSILRLELCREFNGSDAKLFISALDTTAKQLANIKKAVVLKPDGNCLDTADKTCLN